MRTNKNFFSFIKHGTKENIKIFFLLQNCLSPVCKSNLEYYVAFLVPLFECMEFFRKVKAEKWEMLDLHIGRLDTVSCVSLAVLLKISSD